MTPQIGLDAPPRLLHNFQLVNKQSLWLCLWFETSGIVMYSFSNYELGLGGFQWKLVDSREDFVTETVCQV